MIRRLPFRSLTRLVVGGVVNGLDSLARSLELWEQQAALSPDERVPPKALPARVEPVQASEPPPGAVILDEDAYETYTPPAETPAEAAGYALTGLIFAGQEQLERYVQVADRATRLVGNWAELLGGPLVDSRWARPLRSRFDALSAHGQQVVDGWKEVGRQEVDASRRLMDAALTERVDQAINYLTANEEVQELVQSQSAGLVDEVIEEARERTVSADNFLEAMVRSLLRRPPRWELPAPPPEIQQNAETGRQYHGRIVRK